MTDKRRALIAGILHAIGMAAAGMGKCLATGHIDIVCVATVVWGSVGFLVGLYLPQPGTPPALPPESK